MASTNDKAKKGNSGQVFPEIKIINAPEKTKFSPKVGKKEKVNLKF